jgi:hypothetical protein
MPLNPRRVQTIFLEAAEHQDPKERTAILDRECSADPELRGRIEALLRAHDEFNGFLNEPVRGPRVEHRAVGDGPGMRGNPRPRKAEDPSDGAGARTDPAEE